MSKKQILHLVLTGKWYDLIESGKKKKEYRACTPYWDKRLKNRDDFKVVIFHRAYTNITIKFEIKKIYESVEPNDLKLDRVWVIELGRRLSCQKIEK